VGLLRAFQKPYRDALATAAELKASSDFPCQGLANHVKESHTLCANFATNRSIFGHMTRHLQTTAFVFVLAVLYFCAARFGLSLAFVHPSASAVWPPSGIALAALLLWGYRLWPGIFLGALAANIATPGTAVTALSIAAGNTFEAILGAALVWRFANGPNAFEQTKNILKFALLAGILSTAVGATIGATTLSLAGLAPWDHFSTIWLTWWLGDAVGNLIVASLLVLWVTQPLLRIRPTQILEATGLLLALVLVGSSLFRAEIPSGLEYLALVPLLWGALRFGRRGAATSAFAMSAIALWGTLDGLGPFATADPNLSLLFLQVFMATVTVTALVVASVMSERRRLEQRLRIKDAVSRILAESPSIADAAPKIIQVMCETAEWDLGTMWNIDRSSNQLTCIDFWCLPSVNASALEALTRESKFAPGMGLPGRVWSSGKPLWISDVITDSNFLRAPVAAEAGLHAGIGFPIKLGDEVVGVMECFSRETREHDNDFLEMASSIGAQVGQFMERKRAEDALRESESRLRVAMAAGQMGAWEWNLATNRVSWSSSLETIHGLTPGTFGGNFDDFKRDIHPEDLALVSAEIEKTLATRGDYHVIYRIKRPDGLVRWVEGFGHVLVGANGQSERLAGVCMEITERKHAEESLRAKEAQVRLITDTAPVMLAQCSRDERFRFVNRTYAEHLGLAPEQIVGKSITEILGKDASEALRPYIQRVLNGEAVEYEIEITYETIGPRFMHLAYVPEKDVFGNVIGWVSAISDITDRKQTEEMLRQAKDELARSNEDLEKRVQYRTAELQLANAALSQQREEERRLEQQLRQAQKMESIGTLAGGIAHDFNNILNIIKGYASLLRNEGSGDEELTESLDIIDEAIERGASTVRQLLAVAKESAVRFEQVNLNDALRKLKALLSGTLPRTIDIGLDLDPGLSSVLADPNQINQVLLNICLNARDAMPEGGDLLLKTATMPGTELRAHFQNAMDGSYACITVKDTGFGMDTAIRGRIFEPFFTTKEQGQGTGLGLSVAYGIVTSHGGFIDVNSEPGRGTTFRIYLPLSDGRASGVGLNELRDAPETEPAEMKGNVVLFVEDEIRQLELMRRSLERVGYRVLVAMDGVEAVEIFLRHKEEISVVVLDLGLPKLSGWEAFQKMKKADPSLKPILASGYISHDMESAMAEGEISALLMKPYRPDEILEKVSLAVLQCAERQINRP
jgi:two-component system, cell cycle sensor histidine kinase and response regulator CckA